MRNRILRSSGLLILLLGCALALPLGASDQNQVTRRGRNKGLMTMLLTPTALPGIYSVHNEEVGNSIHLGLYHNVGNGIMDLVNGKFLAGWGTTTAANGDTVNWVLDPATGLYPFTGGTGRFEHVSGFTMMTSMTLLSVSGPDAQGKITMVIQYVGEGEITY